MHTKLYSATVIGINAHKIEIEVDLSFGMLQFFLVGLPDLAIKESKQRVITALKNCGYSLPERKITVNLAPAHIKKEGSLFDLPIALGIIYAAKLCDYDAAFLEDTFFVGELSLDGRIKPVLGVLAIAFDALKLGIKRIIVPLENAPEAALIEGLEVIAVSHLTDIVKILRKEAPSIPFIPAKLDTSEVERQLLDLAQVKGQTQAKRVLQIAAAGRHNLLFVGSPGSGKTMLAQRLITIMPPLSFNEMLETSKIYSICGKLPAEKLISQRPCRAPHHTISSPGLVGGGSTPQPGEISLAHNGILFLDEFTEFRRQTLEVLRQPLEERNVTISRAQQTLTFPSSFLLVAALNPCPCGYYGDARKECSCTKQQIYAYMQKLSGPLLDRIDLQVYLPSVKYEDTQHQTASISSAELYAKVTRARERQLKRFNGNESMYNGYMTPEMIDEHCKVTDAAQELIKKAFETLHLSMRGYHKLLKISRTIADLEDSDAILPKHVQEALMYRSIDKSLGSLQ
jgi:magnesium chelatase family protein